MRRKGKTPIDCTDESIGLAPSRPLIPEERANPRGNSELFLVGSCHTPRSNSPSRLGIIGLIVAKRISPAGWQLGTFASRRLAKVRLQPRVFARTWLGFRRKSQDEIIRSGCEFTRLHVVHISINFFQYFEVDVNVYTKMFIEKFVNFYLQKCFFFFGKTQHFVY